MVGEVGVWPSCYLGCSAFEKHNRDGKDDKFEVFPKGLTLKVGDINFDHFLEADFATSIDLPRAVQTRNARET